MRGIVLGQQDMDTALIRLASEQETRRLLTGPRSVDIAGVAAKGQPKDKLAVLRGMMNGDAKLYVNVDGEFFEIGVVREMSLTGGPMLDVTTHADASPRFAPSGLMRVSGSFDASW